MPSETETGPARTLDIRRVLADAAQTLCGRSGSDGCAIMLPDGEGWRLRLVQGRGDRKELAALRPECVDSGQLRFVEDLPPGLPDGARAAAWLGLEGAEGPVGAALLWWNGSGNPPRCEDPETLSRELGRRVESAALFQRVEKAKRQWEATVDALREGIAVVDIGTGRLLRANWALARHLGTSPADLVGMPFRGSVAEPLGLGGVTPATSEGVTEEEEIQSGARTWRVVRYLLESASASVVIFEDVTERRRAHQEILEANFKIKESMERLKATQAQLFQAEKMAAVGQLVSGVAHELNNPLTAVLGFAQLLRQAPDTDKLDMYVETICKESERARKIVQNLLTFARKHRAEKQAVDINEVVRQTLALKAYEMKVSGIELVTDLAEDIQPTRGDFHQLQQVLLNLVNNAVHAVQGPDTKGRIEISTRLRGRSDPGSGAVTGPSVVIEVRDNGHGIPDRFLNRIFEPFFTTKDVGQGTGLGLSLTYGIVQEHGGSIGVESADGKGTCFTVEIPVVAVEAPSEAGMVIPPVERSEIPARRVLVVDDEESIRSMLREILEGDGHAVITAGDGQLALEAIAEDPGFDLILTDLKMPVLDGYGLFERLRGDHPRLAGRVVFITGDTVSQETRNFLLRTGNRYLAKPVSLEQVRQVLGRLCAGEEG